MLLMILLKPLLFMLIQLGVKQTFLKLLAMGVPEIKIKERFKFWVLYFIMTRWFISS